ncbi:hypothetical protein G4T96_001089 [Vibrio cholerae]|uniref:hypothetical protein n=1 Tax=Vibrio cholerae TaxID=666 RepID=UPI002936402A|nr:hypothetical protein [Vibrio cholerae]EGQ8094588.1 hypothetical protein [Vibrio cholerae]MDW4533714.1 hypothetical protein [Vibrio cholerae]
MSDITIDLSTLVGGVRIKKEQLLQQDANKQMDRLLLSMQEGAKKKSSESENYSYLKPLRRCNNTIFIHGERGAGKTTYLHSLIERYQTKEDTKAINAMPLPLIDPTLVSTQQHILVDIIAKFTSLVKSSLNHCCDSDKFERFRSKLDALAEGVQLLSGKVSSSQYDSSWFLSKAIDQSSSGIQLEHGIHALVDVMSDILDADLFFIAIDDVDTDTKKAHEVLEVIRCYLTHPRLVVVLTGDLKLYSHIVKRAKYKELSLKDSGGDDPTTKQHVDHLEQQYLAKVLPVEQRVNLKKISEVAELHTVNITYSSSTSFVKVEVKELCKKIFSEALNTPVDYLKSHLDFVLSLPVRTVFQLLKTMIESDIIGPEKKIMYSPVTLKSALYHSFVGSLVKLNIDSESLSQSTTDGHTIGYEMFKLLHRHGELETGFYVRPDSGYAQNDYNTAKLYLSACIASQFTPAVGSSVAKAIKTMLLCGASSNIYMNFVSDRLATTASEQDYIDYIGLNRFENISSFAAHFGPLVIPEEQGKKAIASGVVRTVRGKPAKFNETLFGTVIKPNERLTKLERLISDHYTFENLSDYVAAKMVLVASHRAQIGSEGRDYISAYRLLAGVAELLTQEHPDVDKLCTIPTYSYPSFFKGKKGDEYNNIDEIDPVSAPAQDPSNDKILKDALEYWVSKYSGQYRFSSLLLGKIWTRLHYCLNQVSESARNKVEYKVGDSGDVVLGIVLSRYVWAIINASLIEESRYGYDYNQAVYKAMSKARNVDTSPRELAKNLNEFVSHKSNDSKMLVTMALISCPLLWPFLGDDELKTTVQKLLSPKEVESFDKFTSVSKPEHLRISGLPIVGFFVN